ncbi:MAG: hypothetical protein MZV64_69015 [Ignavibacteriales bacterium]|nr:hypothetical protein [Ignavibacteriales bacterium]
MKDQFGVIWERQEIIKTDLSKYAAENLANQKNEEIFSGKTDYCKVVDDPIPIY